MPRFYVTLRRPATQFRTIEIDATDKEAARRKALRASRISDSNPLATFADCGLRGSEDHLSEWAFFEEDGRTRVEEIREGYGRKEGT